jgi:hypothetical protein
MNKEAGLVTRPRAAQPKKGSISDGGEIFFIPSEQTGSGLCTASYSAGAGIFVVE